MKTKFKDPIAPKEGKSVKSPWNFEQPSYDERSSCFVNAGTNYGVGHRTPMGKESARGLTDGPIPFGRVNPLETDYVYKGKPGELNIEAKE